MAKKTKDTLITKVENRSNNDSNKQLTELRHLIELVGEITVGDCWLPSSRGIAEKLYSEGVTTISSDVKGKFFNEKILISPNSIAMASGKNIGTTEKILKEIKRITKDFPKFSGFLFDDAQNLYPSINKRYEKNNEGSSEEKLEGIINRYDDILLFAVNLTQLALFSTLNLNESGLVRFEGFGQGQRYYQDISSPRYYIDNGRLRYELDLFAQHSPEIEVARVRYCFVCKSVFWRDDLRQIYCSDKCRNKNNSNKSYANPDNREKLLTNKKYKYHKKKDSNRFPSRVKKEEEK